MNQPDQLRVLIVFDGVITALASLFALAAYVWVIRSPYMVVLAILVGASSVVMFAGLRPLSGDYVTADDVAAALWWLAIANWSISLAVTAIATFTWPLLMLSALLPSAVGPSFVSPARQRVFVIISSCVAATNVLLGLLQDASGLSGDAPAWVRRLVLILFAPMLLGVFALVAVYNSDRVNAALEDAQRAQDEVAGHARELELSRGRVVAAADRERQRIERNLHDGAQQRLIALAMRLSRVREHVAASNPQLVSELDSLRAEVRATHDEVRQLAHGVYPPVLSEHGLVEAVRSVADRSPIEVRLDLEHVGRFDTAIESAVYFCCVEALQNAAKHSQVGLVHLRLYRADDQICFTVSDDGVGFSLPDAQPALGLVGLHDRLGAIGGELNVSSAPGRGTTITGRVGVTTSSASDA